MSTPPMEDGMDFIKKMWNSMGFSLPGMITPTLDTEELERRIADLRTVEGWLKMNLNMLQMTIQGLEVQRATLAAIKAMGQSAENGEAPANPFANPALWTWPFAMPEATPEAAAPAAEAPKEAAPPEQTPPPKPGSRRPPRSR